MSTVYNFSAGPAILPKEVFKQASKDILDIDGCGLSILEISHRSKEFIPVMDKAVELVKDLLKVPEGYSVLFLQGGASTQFALVPYNILGQDDTAAYLETGAWAKKAAKEAKLFGKVETVASSADKNYNYIPKGYDIPAGARYLHVTSNNTIYGTQLHKLPETDVRVVADMSSDIFSRPVDVSKYDIIYAGAQKNMGCAGTVLVIVKDDILGKVEREIPTMFDYRTHIDKGSMFNTPPVFAVYTAMQTLSWLKENGGVEWIVDINEKKAAKLYAEIDRNPLFEGTAAVEDRSNMNVTFVTKNEEDEKAFLEMTTEKKLSTLKGHRSVGGFRASIYNAMPEAGIDALIACMQEFEKKKG